MIKKFIIFALGAYLAMKGYDYINDWSQPIKNQEQKAFANVLSDNN